MPDCSLTRNPESDPAPFPPLPPKRYRGWLYMPVFGEDPDRISAAVICDSWVTAMALATEPTCLDVFFASPDEGRPLRRFLAGGASPTTIPLASCRSLVGLMRQEAHISKQTALRGLRGVIRRRGGFGAECLAHLGPQFNPAWADVKSFHMANRSN